MDIARMIGICIVFGVPAIIVGGLTYHLFESWFAVAGWEILLIIIALATAYNTAGKSGPTEH